MDAIQLITIANPYYAAQGAIEVVNGAVVAQDHKSGDFVLVDFDEHAPQGYQDAGPYQLLALALRPHLIPEEWKSEVVLQLAGVVYVDKSYDNDPHERQKYGNLQFVSCIHWHKDRDCWTFGGRTWLENIPKTPFRKKICYLRRSQ